MAQGGASAQLDARGGLIVGAVFASAANQKSAVLGEVGTVSVDPASQGGAAFFDEDVTITGVKVGDLIFLQPPETLEDELRLVGAAVQAADTVRIRLEATGVIDGAALEWAYLLFRAS